MRVRTCKHNVHWHRSSQNISVSNSLHTYVQGDVFFVFFFFLCVNELCRMQETKQSWKQETVEVCTAEAQASCKSTMCDVTAVLALSSLPAACHFPLLIKKGGGILTKSQELPSLRNSCIKHGWSRQQSSFFLSPFPPFGRLWVSVKPKLLNNRIHKHELNHALTYLPSLYSHFPYFGRAGFMLIIGTCWEVLPLPLPFLLQMSAPRWLCPRINVMQKDDSGFNEPFMHKLAKWGWICNLLACFTEEIVHICKHRAWLWRPRSLMRHDWFWLLPP